MAATALAAVVPVSHLKAGTPGWTTFAILAAIAATAQLFVVSTPRHQAYHTTIVFLIPAVMLLPPGLVALVASSNTSRNGSRPGLPGTSRSSTSATGHWRCWRPGPASTA